MAKNFKKGLGVLLLSIVLLLSSVAAAYGQASAESVACLGSRQTGNATQAVSLTSWGGLDGQKLFGLLPLKSSRTADVKELRLYPGGTPFGIKFMTDGVMVVGFSEASSLGGTENPSLKAGLREGDLIKKIDGREITSAAELTEIVEGSSGRELSLTYIRDGKECLTRLTPSFSQSEGKYKTGIYVRDSGAGIGTVTFIDPKDLSFGGLGHGICDAGSGELVAMKRGSVVDVTVSGVVKGQVGQPGEIKGYFSSGKTGSLFSNTECGVYGMLAELPAGLISEPLPVASKAEIREGRAYIYCTLDTNKVEKYEIRISSIDQSAKGNKCFSIKVTDKALLEKTGGIIQGMSGSPIIQNGKLVGAVTHVLINDPASGYGIFIENMLDQMGNSER